MFRWWSRPVVGEMGKKGKTGVFLRIPNYPPPVSVEPQLVVQAIVALLTGLVYAYVARLVGRRETSPQAARANFSFATFWGTFGALEFLVGLYQLPAAFGYRDLALTITLINLILVMIAVALCGLVYFLVYLYTGSSRAFWPIVGAYAILAVALLYLIAWMQPLGFDESLGPGQLKYAHQLAGAPAITLGLLFTVPVVLAAVGYGTLYFRTQSPAAKLRIGIVALSFLGWFGWSTVSTILELQRKNPNNLALLVTNSAISLVVPILIVIAYKPPAWLRKRIEQRTAEAGL